MESKVCNMCKQKKPVNEFSVNMVKPNGTVVYRAQCKECNAIKAKEKRAKAGKTVKPKKKEEQYAPIEPLENQLSITDIQEQEPKQKQSPIHSIPGKQNNNCECCFSPEVIKFVNELYKNQAKQTINHSMVEGIYSLDKSSRKPKSINIDKDIYNKALEQCKHYNISVSDVINWLLNGFVND